MELLTLQYEKCYTVTVIRRNTPIRDLVFLRRKKKMGNKPKTERIFTPIKNIKHYIDVLDSHGDRTVFKYFGKDRELEKITYHDFAELVKNEIAGLAEFGLKGKRIAIIGETSPFWVATYTAVIASGGVAIPMDRELDLGAIEGFLQFAEADAVVYSAGFNEKFEALARERRAVNAFIPISADGLSYAELDNVVPYFDIIEKGKQYRAQNELIIPEPEDMEKMSVMLFTSGTTGTSKCVMLCEKNVCAAANAACASVEFSEDDVIVSVLPIHHTYELCIMIAATIYGMKVCINDSLKRVLRNFALFKPTGLVLVPLFITTMNKKIWEEARKKGKEKSLKAAIKLSRASRKIGIDMRKKLFGEVTAAFGGRLQKIISGGAPLNPELIKNFEEFGIQICEGYGITECSPLISVSPYYKSKPGSVGPAVESCQVKIDVDHVDENGNAIGEICVKGDNVMLGYYKNKEETDNVFSSDGWFKTGDVGYLDKDGYVFITGRKKFVIVLENGKNVFPEEIEEYLSDIDLISDSVVVGRKAEDSDEIILTAIIYPAFDKFNEEDRENFDKMKSDIEAKIKSLNKKLVSYKHIKAVELRKEDFERTTSKKVKRTTVK